MNELILGLGPVPALMSVAFQLAEGEVEGPIRIPQGYAFITVTAIQAPYIPPLEDVRDEVQDDVIQEKAQVAAREKAAETAASLRDADDFAGAAEAADLMVETTELITRGSVVAGLGVSPELDAAAVSLASGETSDPVQVGSTMAIVHVMERQEVTDAEFAAARKTFRDELLLERREPLLQCVHGPSQAADEDRHQPGNAASSDDVTSGFGIGDSGGIPISARTRKA